MGIKLFSQFKKAQANVQNYDEYLLMLEFLEGELDSIKKERNKPHLSVWLDFLLYRLDYCAVWLNSQLYRLDYYGGWLDFSYIGWITAKLGCWI